MCEHTTHTHTYIDEMMQTQSKNPNKRVLFNLWISPFDRIPIKLKNVFRSLLTDCDALLQLCRKKRHLCHCLVENSSRLWNTHKYLCIIATNRAMNHTQEWSAHPISPPGLKKSLWLTTSKHCSQRYQWQMLTTLDFPGKENTRHRSRA